MLLDYLKAAMRHARYEIFSDDGSFYGEIRNAKVFTLMPRHWKLAAMNWARYWKNGYCFESARTC
jgi:hypothetical protein